MLKIFKSISLALILATTLSACGEGNINWKEEVQLSDGKVIEVQRDAIYVGGGGEWASNRSLSKINEYRIRFEYPIGSKQTIEWRSTKKDPYTYPETPLVLDMQTDKPTIFSVIAISELGCYVYSKYEYQNGKWKEESLPEQFEQHPTNLLFGSQKSLPRLLNLAEKNKRNNNGYRDFFKNVGPNLKVCGNL